MKANGLSPGPCSRHDFDVAATSAAESHCWAMKWWRKVLLVPVVVAAVVLGAPIIALAAVCWLAGSIVIVVAISLFWIPRGQRFLVVYSDSAQWRPYFEEEVLPAFGPSARVINLSRDGGRKKWWHLDWAAFRHCAGYRNRFPAVYCFSAFGFWRAIRFYDAYMLSKKGKIMALDKAKADLFIWKPKNIQRGLDGLVE